MAEALRRRRTSLVAAATLGPAVLLGVFVWGGYDLGWRWTGLSSQVTLWDWLQVLALPVAVGIAPLLLRHRRLLNQRHRAALAAALIIFGALVLAGYVVPMPWTGFTGNTLWDWLELMLLPMVVATATLWAGRERVGRPQVVAGTLGLGGFAVFVLCGYLVPWTWTGFSGNTAWDWIKLLLLPVLVPIVLVPAVMHRLTHTLAPSQATPEATPVNRSG